MESKTTNNTVSVKKIVFEHFCSKNSFIYSDEALDILFNGKYNHKQYN